MNRIDEMDFTTIDGIRCCSGHILPYGATMVGNGGINFSISSHDATGCELCLYHSRADEPYARIPIPQHYRTGDSYSIIVFDQDAEELEYTFRFSGPYDVKAGLRFDDSIDLLDPYAKLISGRDVWSSDPSVRPPLRCKVIYEDFPWAGDRQLETPFEDLIIYEMHVRGFTNSPDSPAKHRGTYAGVVEMIPYFKELGINCVELLPIFEFDELEFADTADVRTHNFWGYSTIGFFAPKAAYAATSEYGMVCDELKNMVRQLHQAGISVILDVVFNHTAEGGDGGPTYNYRGIDNRTYYHLDDEGHYQDYSGCSNTVNCNNAVVRQHILDCLRYWVSNYHVDGFRFDEAPILSRDEDGHPMQNPPLLETLAHDPVLSRTKLIAEAWDAAGLYQVGSFPAPKRWSEWNGKFRDCVRHFIKSDAYDGPNLIKRIQGSPDLYSKKIHPTVNFVTCHDGFTLNDLVSYNSKHNLENGENNRDGADHNISWNCGVEGPTADLEIESLRNRQVKNAFALLMLSRGTPMMLAGDEFRNSQGGNNNSYCQDNEISWINWHNRNEHADVFEFFRLMILLRRSYPVVSRHTYRTAINETGYPELSFHGEQAWYLDMANPFHTFGFMYAQPGGKYNEQSDAFIYCGVNAHWEERTLELPILPAGLSWHKYVYTADNWHDRHEEIVGNFRLAPRSLVVLIAQSQHELDDLLYNQTSD
ncbi:MAG: alpha-amylase family glycosyl hydrolase [Coriobacteriales bacterium]|nr:alpha-amylase family glycosyl hydrolase [Coriobacteriales bacterium]